MFSTLRAPSKVFFSLFFCLALSPVGLLDGAINATPDAPEVRVIDMHTHVFNARDLPLVGILTAKMAPRPVAVVMADIILSSMQEEEGGPRKQSAPEDVERPRLRELSGLERNILYDFVGPGRRNLIEGASGILGVSPDVVLVAHAMAQIGFPPGEALTEQIAIKAAVTAQALATDLKGIIRFIGIMTKQHGEIVATMELKYPQVDLFVHHLMDMATGYDDDPTVLFQKQLPMMQQLDEAFPGKLLHFAAFDPFRRKGALPLADKAVTDFAAVGWKIYPPSGYRAADNAKEGFPPKPSWAGFNAFWLRRQWNRRYEDWTPKDLDDTLQSGFSRATKKPTVPLFTHCTPGGFQAAKDYGKMADPRFWETALKANPGLRLCFGHSGGEWYWFSDTADDSKHTSKDDPWLFGEKVVKLCQTYENVYCDVGYLDGIRDPKNAERLIKRLESVVDLPAANGKKFGDKIMYGTDWHMIYKEPDYEDYLSRWNEVMKKVKGGAWRAAFFSGNAKQFLQIDQLAKDSRFSQAQRNELDRLSKAIK